MERAEQPLVRRVLGEESRSSSKPSQCHQPQPAPAPGGGRRTSVAHGCSAERALSLWFGEEVQALLRCQNVATNNGVAFSETKLISAENTCGYKL